MEASILIVSRNRVFELEKTLSVLLNIIDMKNCEIAIFLDGYLREYEDLKHKFPLVTWFGAEESLGASKARNVLYKKARGKYLFGFDDDAHPVETDFIAKAIKTFLEYPNLGIIAFREVKGCFSSDKVPNLVVKEDYFTNDFMGCGFAIKRQVYEETRGFPKWIDIYGEESCVALETLALGYDILYTHKITVNHRVDKMLRERAGRNYFRFGKQLKNVSYFYLVYYPFPFVLRKLAKLYFHNFQNYALKDRRYFQAFWVALWKVFCNSKEILQYRKPVTKDLIVKIQKLKQPEYH